MPNLPAPDFKVGDKAVHPAHGVGEVTAIEQREIGGTRATFYILRILDNGMKVMVPTTAATQVGLRGIMSDNEADNILSTMRAREVAVDVQPWSRRFRVYTEMIKSGSATEIAKVLRDMNRLKFDKELSFGERRLLDQAAEPAPQGARLREEEDRGRNGRRDPAHLQLLVPGARDTGGSRDRCYSGGALAGAPMSSISIGLSGCSSGGATASA